MLGQFEPQATSGAYIQASGFPREKRYSDVRPRDSRDGMPGPGMTSGTVERTPSAVGAADATDVSPMMEADICLLETILNAAG